MNQTKTEFDVEQVNPGDYFLLNQLINQFEKCYDEVEKLHILREKLKNKNPELIDHLDEVVNKEHIRLHRKEKISFDDIVNYFISGDSSLIQEDVYMSIDSGENWEKIHNSEI